MLPVAMSKSPFVATKGPRFLRPDELNAERPPVGDGVAVEAHRIQTEGRDREVSQRSHGHSCRVP